MNATYVCRDTGEERTFDAFCVTDESLDEICRDNEGRIVAFTLNGKVPNFPGYLLVWIAK